jgi:hypothetical protein
VPSSWASSVTEGARRRAIDAALALAVLLCGARFLGLQWRWNEAPAAAAAIEFLAAGADYEADRFRDGIGAPGWCTPVVREWGSRLAPGACVAVDGPWVLQRAARYDLYPRLVLNHVTVAREGAGLVAALERDGADAVAIWPPERPEARALAGDRRFRGLGAGVFALERAGEPAAPEPFELRDGVSGPPAVTVIARVLLAIGAILALGLAIGRLAFPRAARTVAGRLAQGFLLGALAIALESLALGALGVRTSLGADAVLAAGALATLGLRRAPALADPGARRIYAAPLLALVLLQIAVGALLALGGAPRGGDDLAEWALKAKHYFAAGAVALPGAPREGAFLFRSYPPLVPALLAFVYRVAGGVVDGPAKLVFAAFFAATLGALYDGLRGAGLAHARALAWTAIAAISGNELVNHAGYAWADLPLAAFTVAAGAAFMTAGADARGLALGGVLAGAGALTKLEGAPVGLALVALAAVGARRPRLVAATTGPFVALLGLWIAHCAAHGIGPEGEHLATFAPARIALVLPLVGRALLSDYRFAGAFPLVGAGLAIGLARGFPARSWVAAGGFLAALALLLAAYVVTAYDGDALIAHVGFTAPRLLLHASPLGFLAAAVGAMGREGDHDRCGRNPASAVCGAPQAGGESVRSADSQLATRRGASTAELGSAAPDSSPG